MMEWPVDEVKDSRGFPLVSLGEVGPDAGQPGEGPKLCRNVVCYGVGADGEAHATGWKECDSW
jgi:hypothetical protein